MYLVTGATGTVGRPLVDALLTAGVEVRAVTRDPQNASFPTGVEVVAPETIRRALSGCHGLFVHPRAAKDDTEKLLRVATEEGVRKVVVMSAINVEDEPGHQPSRFNGDRNTEVEQAVRASTLPWVAVRPSSFATNTLGMWRAQAGFGDTIRGPYAGFAEAVIDERDVAEVIARALVDDTLLGRTIPLTGPEALRLDDMVAILGTALGRPLRFEEVPADVAAQGMVRAGLDERFVQALLARYRREMDRPAIVTTEVATILGRPARTFATWAADHAGAWS
ncbi:SDR family oxidoreductase [Nocardia goodfellowii]